jgi:predicted amidohydrolase
VLSRHDNEIYVHQLLTQGVNGYVLKDDAGETIGKTSRYIKLVLEQKEDILKTVSRATGSCVVLPLVESSETGSLFNTSFIINDGTILGGYREIHVFPWGEFFFDCGENYYECS